VKPLASFSKSSKLYVLNLDGNQITEKTCPVKFCRF